MMDFEFSHVWVHLGHKSKYFVAILGCMFFCLLVSYVGLTLRLFFHYKGSSAAGWKGFRGGPQLERWQIGFSIKYSNQFHVDSQHSCVGGQNICDKIIVTKCFIDCTGEEFQLPSTFFLTGTTQWHQLGMEVWEWGGRCIVGTWFCRFAYESDKIWRRVVVAECGDNWAIESHKGVLLLWQGVVEGYWLVWGHFQALSLEA